MIAIKKWKSRNHPVPKSNIRTNSRNNETSSGGDSFELKAISIICHPPTSSNERNYSEPTPIEIFEQLPNGKLFKSKFQSFHVNQTTNFFFISALVSKMNQLKK